MLSIAVAWVCANGSLAQWTFTYTASGNQEFNRVYVCDPYVYYDRTQDGATLSQRMRVDNIRRVTINETTSEIAVQVWGYFHTSVLVLHFTKTQRELAHEVAQRIERLQFGG